MFLICSGMAVDLQPLPMHERHAFGLERLAEMSGKLVEQAYHRAIVAEGPEAKDSAALVFDRLARGFRLTLSLEARFARDVRREARESAEPAPQSLPRPVAAPQPFPASRPERPAREPAEADHESEMEVEETSDALAARVKDLSHILEDQADTLDPDGAQRANLDRLAAWWAEGQRYEPGAQTPKPQSPKSRSLKSQRPKARRVRPPRPKDLHPKDVPDDDVEDEIDDDFDIDDDDPLWLESG